MNSEEQEKQAKKNCGKLYRKVLTGCEIIMDDEKYFTLSGNNVSCNRYFYSTNPATTPPNIKFRKKAKFEPKVMIWMAISTKGIFDVYVHKSKLGVDQKTYLQECINKRLIPFIDKYHYDGNYLFWPDLASSHYSKVVQERLNQKNIPFISRNDNPPNVPQGRPIERVCRKNYEHKDQIYLHYTFENGPLSDFKKEYRELWKKYYVYPGSRFKNTRLILGTILNRILQSLLIHKKPKRDMLTRIQPTTEAAHRTIEERFH
ncbi:unnamed protein product [Rotaria sordida]|uniref:Transposase n=1 Tax=Rotaria sordida TaxID=392033 RepID=A0A813Y4A8_9BILA|nr:unnamed protein product [Rotaria sordida]CAF3976462.1 unnamed protein product [Rotaria sordida]